MVGLTRNQKAEREALIASLPPDLLLQLRVQGCTRSEIADVARKQASADNPKEVPVNIKDTPEFKEALASIKDELIAELKAVRVGGDNSAAPSTDTSWMKMLALEISQLADQGTGRGIRVSPEVMEQRKRANERMEALLHKAREEKNQPKYRLNGKVYLQEVLIDPIYVEDHKQKQTEIGWYGPPSIVMVPANEIAEEIVAAFRESIGNLPKDVPTDKPILGVTAGGLSILSGGKSVQPPVALATAPPDHLNPRMPNDDLTISHRGRPGQFVEKNILGTVHPPSRQTI